MEIYGNFVDIYVQKDTAMMDFIKTRNEVRRPQGLKAIVVNCPRIAAGYKEYTKVLTRGQVKVIVQFLDPP